VTLAIRLAEKLARFPEQLQRRVVGEFSGRECRSPFARDEVRAAYWIS